jgi:hypothetical protein
MARTFVDQPTQVFHSDTYNDQFSTGVNLVSSSTSLEDDLNALRTQVRQALWAQVPGNWYDMVSGTANISFARGVQGLNASLTTVEQQRFIYDVQSLAYVVIPSGSNWVSLSVSGSTAPSGLAAVGLGAVTGSFTGSICATLPGQPGVAHSLNLISGTSALTPRNMVAVRDAYTHLAFSDAVHGNHEVYGLLQIESGALDAQPFSDTAPGRTQISFVVEYPSGTWIPADVTAIGGKIVNYQYRARTNYLGLPEDAYTNTVFVDVTPLASGFAQLSDITLQEAINNQGNTTVNENGFATKIDLAGGGLGSWQFVSGATNLFQILASTNTINVGGTNFNVNSTNPASFLQGIKVDTAGTEIDIGVHLGMIQTPSGSNLILSGGAQLDFSDWFGPLSTYPGGMVPLATSSAEWSTFFSDFGAASILGAFNQLFITAGASASGTLVRARASAGVTPAAGVTPGTNVTFPTNLDAALLNYTGRDFVADLNIYLNGILLLPGNSTNQNDVYPGTSAATGDLKFPMKIRSGSIISMERFGLHG